MNTPNTIAEKSKYFIYIAIAFVTVLIISNTVGSKIVQIGPFFLAGATFIFPVSYIFGDILTEVYGYAASRKIIWSGFVALIFSSIAYWFVQMLPPAPFWQNQEAFEAILGVVPRIAFAGIVAYFIGEFFNSFVLSKMKILTEGKYLWTRTIGSTVVGEGVDSLVFGILAFIGTMPTSALITLILSLYLFKVLVEVILTPVTYMIVNKLKVAEGIDVYDKGVNYNPFVLNR